LQGKIYAYIQSWNHSKPISVKNSHKNKHFFGQNDTYTCAWCWRGFKRQRKVGNTVHWQKSWENHLKKTENFPQFSQNWRIIFLQIFLWFLSVLGIQNITFHNKTVWNVKEGRENITITYNKVQQGRKHYLSAGECSFCGLKLFGGKFRAVKLYSEEI